MKFLNIVKALVYREFIFIRNNIGEYVVLSFISIFFAISIIGIAISVGGTSKFIHRFIQIFQVSNNISLSKIVAALISLSGLLSIVADIVGSVSQIVIYEINFTEVIYMIAQSVDLYLYYMAYALVSGIISSIVSTIYLIPTLLIVSNLSGLFTYLILLPIFIITGIALAYYTLIISLPVALILNVKRPWIISQVFVPAIIAGTGIFIPINFVPIFIRILAYTTPLPEICIILQNLLLKNTIVKSMIIIFVILLTLYISTSVVVSLKSDKYIRRGL